MRAPGTQADLLVRAGMPAADPDELLAWILDEPAPPRPTVAQIAERVEALLADMTVAEKAGPADPVLLLQPAARRRTSRSCCTPTSPDSR